jgi:hypothetical protein
MGQFGLNLDEESVGFCGSDSEGVPLSHDDLQRIRAHINETNDRSSPWFTIGLFAAGFAVGFLVLYFATGLSQHIRASALMPAAMAHSR